MHWRSFAALTAIACGLTVLFAGPAEARVVKSRADLNFGPKFIRYDAEKDELIRQKSILTRPDRRPGGKLSYSGTRLKQYEFHGKPGRGGIYDAFEDYRNELKLDPKLYQYRRHREF